MKVWWLMKAHEGVVAYEGVAHTMRLFNHDALLPLKSWHVIHRTHDLDMPSDQSFSSATVQNPQLFNLGNITVKNDSATPNA